MPEPVPSKTRKTKNIISFTERKKKKEKEHFPFQKVFYSEKYVKKTCIFGIASIVMTNRIHFRIKWTCYSYNTVNIEKKTKKTKAE